jgi:arabinofuranan 3-O-arabinosyltransferase
VTGSPSPWFERPFVRTAGVLALLAYLPALTAAPGRMPSDSKLYLYLDPARFFGDAASSFDARQFAGWVPHQHIAYLWPSTPWFWLFDTLGVPDWIAHRLWIGTIMLAAGLGVRWCARLLGLGPVAAFVAATTYQLAVYVLPYVSRTSVMLLPWAGMGWIVAFTIRATRRRTWGDPAAVALVVLTVGAVNATALAMIVPAPVLWLVHTVWQRSLAWREAALVAVRVAVLSLAVSLWWIAMLVIQGRYGTDVLPYSESLADVSLTATSAETWRGLGYWLFYVRDPYAATTTASLRYLSSTVSIAISYAIPLLALAAVACGRWTHRRFAAMLIGVGLVLAVGVHPIDDRSPLMRILASGDDGGLALALRSSTRALPVTMLGMALAVAMAVDASHGLRVPRLSVPTRWVTGAVVVLVAVLNLPALWTGGFVDPALERDQDPPDAWLDAAAVLDGAGDEARVLQLPGAEFGAYRWGYTVDQPLPGLTEKPLVTRDLLPLGSAGAMDLLYALDDRIQDGVFEAESVGPVARLLGVDTIWLINDIAFDRFRTARPEVVRDIVGSSSDVGELVPFGRPFLNRPDVPMTDERAVGDPRVGGPMVPVELARLDDPGAVVRAAGATLVVSGSGDGLVDAAAAGLIDPEVSVVRYSADLADIRDVLDAATGLVVTDSNRDRARHWRSSQDTTGYTEPGGPDQAVLRPVSSDARLDLFGSQEPATQTIAEQRGPVRASATSYGEPFAYLPEHRPFMAIDGDPSTAWTVGEHGDPVGELLRLEFERPVDRLVLHQPTDPSNRRIARVTVDGRMGGSTVSSTVDLDETSRSATGQELRFDGPVEVVEITIDSIAGGTPYTGSAVAGVGFSEIEHGLGATVEVVRPPHDALSDVSASTPLALSFTRLRTDPMDRWRDDPEPELVRGFELPGARELDTTLTMRIDARSTDAELAALFGWPATASTRLTGSPRNAGVSAIDGDTSTAWITAFGAAAGATLATTADRPISSIEVVQPVAGFSRVSSLTVTSNGESRVVDIAPDAGGGAVGVVEPPLGPGPVTFELSGVEPETTIDRRFGDPVTLPAAISELRFDGRPVAGAVGSRDVTIDCVPVATVDEVAIMASITVAGDGWLDGAPLLVEPCGPTMELDAGAHLLTSTRSDLPVTIDRIVLDDGVRRALADVPATVTADVVGRGRFDRTIRVTGCDKGCWLVVGEGFDEAWAADGPNGVLGRPELIDGGFNGWWIPPTDTPVLVDVRWTPQRGLALALLISTVAGLACCAIVARDRGRDDMPPEEQASEPAWVEPGRSLSDTARIVAAALWTLTAVLLIGPEWALWGALGGLAVISTRRVRLPEFTALASLLVVAVVVIARERRTAPLPNGGWPGTFESLHELGMFAIVAVLVGALVADDATDVSGTGLRAEDAPDT